MGRVCPKGIDGSIWAMYAQKGLMGANGLYIPIGIDGSIWLTHACAVRHQCSVSALSRLSVLHKC